MKRWLFLLLLILTGCQDESKVQLIDDLKEVEACTIEYGTRFVPLQRDISEYQDFELEGLLVEYESVLSSVTLLYSNERYNTFHSEIDADVLALEQLIMQIKTTLENS